MKVIEKSKKVLSKGPFAYFPNGHILAVSGLSLCLLGFLALPSEEAEATRNIQTIDIPNFTIDRPEIAVEHTTPSAPVADLHVNKVTVKSGDNLSRIFKRAGLNDRSMMEFLSAHPESKRLASLYPGHQLEFSLDSDNKLQRLNYVIDRLNSFTFSKGEQGFEFQTNTRTPDIRMAHGSAFITQSLYTAGIDSHLDDKLIMELADIFGWDVDFALDIRKGDYFKVVYEEKFLDGEKIGNGNIIAAEFVNQGTKFQAVRYTDAKGKSGYFTPEGDSMRKEFLRAPVDFRRISSNFNPRRLHPVLKTRRPHRGIDYAANTGTPVWSSGNGRVIASGYSKANGNYVVIQHGNSIQTKYLHLHKRHVKKGQRVKQKQKIGTVGSTGLATGPHLHYEFLMNGVHRNPRTIVGRLPKAKSISPNELTRFLLQTRNLTAQLNDVYSPTQYATADSEKSTKSL
ncbi:peptidoglycan DD-metalloendopeptidase family protein [Agarilytica rhodophyticola]|uniref:peptidoglycan DD-metalloendopeptidase family protein n=1 Tax=Agarilytica rhodophyticola TaxID=1737490 RepID=UPI000B341ED9|nr:peptidoglycan DD-metalloendopeptidase family protein [Agarilytica rhodophyticola]